MTSSSIVFTINQSNLDHLLEDQGGEVDDYIHRITVRVMQRAKITSPHRSFEMRESHTTRRASGRAWQVVVPVEYAMAVHNGRRALTIKARRKKSLRWVDPNFHQSGQRSRFAFAESGDGEAFFAESVNTPATKGQPWLKSALIKELAKLKIT